MAQPHGNSNEFTMTHDMATQLTAHEFIAAPGTGLAIYITDIEFYQGAASVAATLLSGTDAMWVAKPAISGQATAHFRTPLKLGSNKALNATTGGASTAAWIVLTGFISRG